MDSDASIFGVKVNFDAIYLFKNIFFQNMFWRSVTHNLPFVLKYKAIAELGSQIQIVHGHDKSHFMIHIEVF